MATLAEFLQKAISITKRIQEEKGKKLVDFVKGLEGDEEVAALKATVKAYATGFSIPGI